MNRNSRIFISGDKGIVGRALLEHFKLKRYKKVFSESGCGLDLLKQTSVSLFFKKERPEYVFLAYSKSGGIAVNAKFPATFIYDNLQAEMNIMHYSYKFGVNKLLLFGSSCIYPKGIRRPIKEESLFQGELEKTSEPYAVSKIAGIKMAQAYNRQYGSNFVSLIPATIYGPKDDFDLENGHVISSLIRKFYQAKIKDQSAEVTVWGSGKARREFIYIDDLIDAGMFLMKKYNKPEMINVGCQEDISIKELALLIKDIVGFKGKVIFDSSRPEGALRKLLDSSKIKRLGWSAKISLREGITRTYNWYKENLI